MGDAAGHVGVEKAKAPLSLSSRLQGYLPALCTLAIAAAIHYLCRHTVGITLAGIFFVYLLAVLISAWCGYGPGLLVLFLALMFVPQYYKPNFSIRKIDPTVAIVLVMISAITSSLSKSRRNSELLLQRVNEDLDERVRLQTSTLKHHLAELETLYAKLSVGLAFYDVNLRYLRVNEKLASFNGAPIDAHVGRHVRDMLPPTLADTVEPLYKNVLETRTPIIGYELRSAVRSAPGVERDWMVSISPVEAENGKVLGLQVIVQDITERKLGEANLKRANEALQRANSDLAQFSYVAAHDLQEPLRTVVSFSQLIARRCGETLDPQSKQFLGYVVDSANHMNQLIEDVLTYSHATTQHPHPPQPVDLDRVLDSVLDTLTTRIMETQAKITRGPLPVVDGDAGRLGQVFQNLLGNSLKYRRAGVVPEIAVSATLQDANWTIAVRDNGQGFRQEYAGQVFGMFKRLQGKDIPGSGIGLAICKSVVESYGGRIWAESAENQGASFYFTLPAQSGSPKREAARA